MKPNKQLIIGILSIVVLTGGLIWLARPQSQTPAQEQVKGDTTSEPSNLIPEELAYDFGTVSMADGTVSHAFKVKNTGAQTSITKVYTSCMCTTAQLKTQSGNYGPFGMPGHGVIPKINGVVNAGETAEINVTFDPSAHGPAGVGKIERVVYVESGNGAPVELKISAQVTP